MPNVTVSGVKKGVIGDLRYATGTLTLSTTYTAGGDSLLPNQVGMRSFISVFVETFTELSAAPAGAKNLKVLAQVDGSVKIKGFLLSTNAEITAAPTDQSAITGVEFLAIGKS